MRARIFTLFIFIGIFVGLLIFTGCKNTDDPAQYTLTVTLGEGVTGTPAAGTSTYTENDVVTYNYSAQSGYGNLTVTLDGVSIPASGTITITANHTLNVTSDIDIRGKWTGHFYHGVFDNYFEVTFSGDMFSGTAQGKIDVYGNGNGDYTIIDGQIEFTLQLSQFDLNFNGTINDVIHMSGPWQIPTASGLSASLPKKLPSNGNWELER